MSRPADSSVAEIAVVIVTYQSAADLSACVGSLAAAAGPHPLEAVVVDNASRDESVEIARDLGVKVIENHTNEGLSRAINRGVAATSAPWLLVANPDTRLAPGAVTRLLETGAADERIGCVGPRLLNPDGSRYPTGRRFPSLLVGSVHAVVAPFWPTNPATRRYHMVEVDRHAPVEVDWVSGACMLIRRSAFEAVGGFDPAYFMYFEEMDFCLRLARTGWRVIFDPLATVEHTVGGSTRSAPYRKVVNHHRSALRFYCRWYAHDPRLLLAPVVAVSLLLRALASIGRTWVGRRGTPSHQSGTHAPTDA